MKKVLLVLGLALAALVGVVATRPDTFHVERSTTINAPPGAVFAAVSDFRVFPEWSPWEKRDPAMRKTLSPNPAGVGASYAWEGNKEVGKGRLTITEAQPPGRVRHRLEFIEPFASIAETGFDIKPEGASGSHVTWLVNGHNDFLGKAFGLFMDMDEAIGKDYEEGLASLKRLVESKPAAAPPPAAAAPPPPPPPPPPPGPPGPPPAK
jgi:hypothetical protein